MRDAQFDVFLSHSSDDDAAAIRIATRLREAGFAPWIDNWYCSGGGRFLHEIDQGIKDSRAFAVLIGPGGITEWMSDEIDVAYSRSVNDRSFRVFLVLLPGLPDPLDRTFLLSFLRTKGWVDFRKGFETEHQFQAIVHAIQGRAPEPPDIDRSSAQEPPYRGLEVFDEAHAEFYFGRDTDVQHLLEMLKGSRFLAVIGPSGTGKSSLVRAGLIPALRGGQLPASEQWRIVVTRPGAHPLASLAAELVRLDPTAPMGPTLDRLSDDARTLDHVTRLLFDQSNPRGRLLLVVDQFEEFFTLCHDEDERQRYIDTLLYAATVPDGRCLVVITLRADFYPRCAAYPELAALVGGQQVLIGPLDREGLRAVIVEPAYKAGLQFEDGLVDLILEDVERQPGALPLLEHALLELFNERRGTLLTLEGYQASGGVSGAIAKTAESQFAALTPEEQVVARRMFLRLTEPGEGTEDTRRRARLDELALSPGDVARVETVVDRLVEARLITTSVASDAHGQPQVDVAHEALIRGWPRLKSWLDEDRAGLRVQRRITNDALEWQRRAYDEDTLYRGARLLEANEFAQRPDSQLNELELAFIGWGNAIQDRERAEVELRRLQKDRDRRRLVQLLSAAALLLLIGFGVAVYQRENAIDDRNLRATAEAEAVAQQAIAEVNARDADAAKVQAQHAEGTAQAEAARAQTAEALQLVETDRAQIAEANAVAQQATAEANAQESKARELAAVASSGTVRIDQALLAGIEAGDLAPDSVSPYLLPQLILNEPRFLKLLTPPNPDRDLNYEFCFLSDSGHARIASLSRDETVEIWDIDNAQLVTSFGTGHYDAGNAGLIACDPKVGQIATASHRNGDITVWNSKGGTVTLLIPHEKLGTLRFIQFTPSGDELVIQTETGTIVWNITDNHKVTPRWVPAGPGALVGKSVRFGPDGTVVAIQDLSSGQLQIVDQETGQLICKVQLADPETEMVRASAISPDGRFFVAALQSTSDYSGTVVTVPTAMKWPRVRRIPLTMDIGPWTQELIMDIAVSPDNYWIAMAGESGKIWLLADTDGSDTHVDVQHPIESIVPGYGIYRVVFEPGGNGILASLGIDGSIAIWDLFNVGIAAQTVVEIDLQKPGIDLNADGSMLAAMSCDSHLSLWRLDDYTAVYREGPSLPAPCEQTAPLAVAISEDGMFVAAGRADGEVVLLDVENGSLLGGSKLTAVLQSLRFSEDHLQLFGLDDRGVLHRWDVTKTGLVERDAVPVSTGPLLTSAWSANGRYLVIGSGPAIPQEGTDNAVLWDMNNLATSWQLPETQAVLFLDGASFAIGPDGSHVVAVLVDGKYLAWFRDAQGEWSQQYVGYGPNEFDGVVDLALLEDGTELRLSFGNRIGVFQGVAAPLLSWLAPEYSMPVGATGSSIAISADGKVLATGHNYSLWIWKLDDTDWRERACDAVGRNFTMEEWQQFFGDAPYRRTCEQFPLGWGVPLVEREALLPWV